MKEKKPKVRIVLEAEIPDYEWHEELVQASGLGSKVALFWRLHDLYAKQTGFRVRPSQDQEKNR